MTILALRLLVAAISIGAGLLLLGLLMETYNALGFKFGAIVHSGLIFLLWPVLAIGIYMLLWRWLRLKTRGR